jgi:PHD-like zinc-binding domain
MDSVASYDEENSDSDYVNVSSEEEISEEELEENVSTKRKNLQLNRRKDGCDSAKAPLSKLNIKQITSQPQVKMSLKRKFAFPSGSVKKENDGSTSSSISFQLISASQSPEENSSISIPTTPTMELDAINNASLLMPAPGSANDEPPYFPEKYGKLCAFCNLGERSQLGQGEMLRLEMAEEEIKTTEAMVVTSQEEDSKNGNDDIGKITKSSSGGGLLQQLNRRQKGLNKCKNPIQTTEYVDEFDKIGHQEPVDLNQLVENGFFYVHRSCALWSFGVVRDPINESLSGVSAILQQSLNRKCSHCNHFGASATCKMSCQKAFHFPCIAASGSFQVFQNCSVFCTDHLGQVPLVCKYQDCHLIAFRAHSILFVFFQKAPRI